MWLGKFNLIFVDNYFVCIEDLHNSAIHLLPPHIYLHSLVLFCIKMVMLDSL